MPSEFLDLCLKKYILHEQKNKVHLHCIKFQPYDTPSTKMKKKQTTDLISSNVGAFHGKYFKATTFKLTFFIQHLIKCTLATSSCIAMHYKNYNNTPYWDRQRL